MGTPILSDLLSDYVGEADDEGDRTADAKDSDVSQFISSRQVYECKKRTATRDVTDINWSPLLVTYFCPPTNYWSLENLREPVESIQVGKGVACFGVAPEPETLPLGDEHGLLHSTSASGQQRSSRKHLRKLDSSDKEGDALCHYCMIASISMKTLKSGSSLRTAGLSKGFLRGSGGLVLTAGVDWTVKLWSPAYSDAPLMSFVSASYDYMCDAKWSPVHPSPQRRAMAQSGCGTLAHP